MSRIIANRVPFTQVPNDPLRDKNISFRAKGLLSLMLSHSEDFVLYKKDLVNYGCEGEQAIDKAWKELVKAGYIQSKKQYNTTTKLVEWTHIVHLTPITISEPVVSEGSVFEGSENAPYKEEQVKNTNDKNTKIDIGESEKKVKTLPYQEMLDLFASDEYKQSVELFADHRKQIKKQLTKPASRLIIAKLRSFGEDGSIASLKTAVEKGWTTVYPPKQEDVVQINTIGITPHYQDPKAIEVYNKLKAKGFRNCTSKEVEWCFDFQRTDNNRQETFSRHELLINRTDPQTYGEMEDAEERKRQQDAQKRFQFTMPPVR